MKRNKKMYAMKYMNKEQCLNKGAIRNVVREVEILSKLDHPFLVNLWFSFQDAEDMFMVVDLLLGGDLRYHLLQSVYFPKEDIRLYLCEIASALDYLRLNSIVHRDVKPENLLLDAEGHVHLTDFNIATCLPPKQRATSVSGTKPYMAPEVYYCSYDSKIGYGPAVDWWSLGVCLFEVATGIRPFDIHSVTSSQEAINMMERLEFPEEIDEDLKEVLEKLMERDENIRITNSDRLRSYSFVENVSVSKLYAKELQPQFLPSKNHLNCDPTLELEEMIIETRPLHKKKKRLNKHRSVSTKETVKKEENDSDPEKTNGEGRFIEEFPTYNREKEIARIATEAKENAWEAELLLAMAKSDPNPEKVPLNRLKVTRISEKHRVSSSEIKARIEGSLAQLENKNIPEDKRSELQE
ncbi:serine/threonine-protein kinase 32B-like isoform X2 [Artemia franciscana]